MDYERLKRLKPAEFEDAADGYREASHMASRSKEDIDQKITAKMRQALNGEAVDAAVKQLRKLSQNFHYTQVECGLAGTALNALASELRAAQKKLDAAVADAQAEGFTVKSNGSVSYPAGGETEHGKTPEGGTATADAPTKRPSTPLDIRGEANSMADSVSRQAANAEPNPHAAKAHAIAVRIAAAVKEATEADHKWAPQLRKLKADDDLTVSSADWADAQKDTRGTAKDAEHYLHEHVKDPPRHGSPRDNAAWWKHLSQDDKDAYVSTHPASVGAMNGLPAEVRDKANRTVLTEKRAEAALPLQEHLKREPKMNLGSGMTFLRNPEWTEWDNKRAALQKKYDSLHKLDTQLADKSSSSPGKRPYLLGIDPRGDGKGIVALGNPDTADHTAIHVPGTGTDISSMPGQIERIDKLHNSAAHYAGGQSVSTITWLGYDAPEIDKSVATQERAHDAAPDLQQFAEGTRAAHQGSPSHLTVLGHSYGSTAVGAAASTGPGLGADDIVTLGSPGTTVEKAEDLHIDPKHVWAGASIEDKIPRMTSGLTLGPNPAEKEFGAEPMDVKDGDHSSYWDKGSASLKNQGRVVAGLPATLREYYHPKPVGLSPDGVHPIIKSE